MKSAREPDTLKEDIEFLAAQKIYNHDAEDRCVFYIRYEWWVEPPWVTGYEIPYAEMNKIEGRGDTAQEAIDILMIDVMHEIPA